MAKLVILVIFPRGAVSLLSIAYPDDFFCTLGGDYKGEEPRRSTTARTDAQEG